MGESDGRSWAPLGIPPGLHLRSSSLPFFISRTLRRLRARQINSLRFSAFQLPLPPLPDHVVYPEIESGVFGTLERISTRRAFMRMAS